MCTTPFGKRPLRRLDLICLGANPEKLAAQQEIPAAAPSLLTDEQRAELYRLNYKRRVSTLSPAEEMLRYRLEQISRGRK
jgi:hypothetical protein